VHIENLALESYFWSRGVRWIAGVDEAGRGPLAGPVVAAACLIPKTAQLVGVRDSKELTPRSRKKVFWSILKQTIIGIGVVTEQEIDRINILRASLLAMRQAVLALPISPDLLLIDGHLKIDLPIDQIPVVSGDKRLVSVAAASIAAKVTRDEMMIVWDRMYPHYGFAKHKGYPTLAHRKALKEWGPSPLHRKTFRPVEEVIAAARA